jgi:hypothetical protein
MLKIYPQHNAMRILLNNQRRPMQHDNVFPIKIPLKKPSPEHRPDAII